MCLTCAPGITFTLWQINKSNGVDQFLGERKPLHVDIGDGLQFPSIFDISNVQ
jgi:hypothetical protein